MCPRDLAVFAARCGQWSDDYLLEEFTKGAAAYADTRFFDTIQAEVAQRGLDVAAPPPLPDSPPAAAPTTDQPFFSSLWRGEVPLAQSYWIWNVIESVLFSIIFYLALGILPIVAFLLWFLQVGYAVFISVAMWRSANRYTGRPLWATLARAVAAVRLTVDAATVLAVAVALARRA